MLTKEAEDKIRKQAFYDELEKLGAVGLLASALRAFRPLWSGALKWAPKITNKISPSAAAQVAKQVGEAGQRGRFFGKFGPKVPIAGIQKVKPGAVPSAKFLENPVAWTEKSVKNILGRTAQNIESISQTGYKGFVKQKWGESKYFSKNIGGKNVLYERTLPGRIASTAGSTGLGWGGASFALAGQDPITGKKNSLGKRTWEGIKETALWGALGPAYGAKIMAYDIPKMGLSLL